MPIVFPCQQCGRLLNTPDGTAGRKAQCPDCGTVVQIPAVATQWSQPYHAPPGEREYRDDGNPFQTPLVQPTVDSGREPSPRGSSPFSYLDAGDVFATAWGIFRRQWPQCVAGVSVLFAVSVLMNLAVTLWIPIPARNAAPEVAFQAMGYGFLASIAIWLVTAWFRIGQTRHFLTIARGRRPAVGDLLLGGSCYFFLLATDIFFGLAFWCGLLLCIVPGLIVGLMFSQYRLLVVDRDCGPIAALTVSHQITNGNKLTLFAIGLVWMLIHWAAVGAVYLFALALRIPFFSQVPVLQSLGWAGLLAAAMTAPFITLLWTVVYLRLTGQPIAATDNPVTPDLQEN